MRAALRAGYKKATARAYSYKLMKDEKIVSRICELQEEYIKNSLLDNRNRVLKELWEIYERSVQAKPVEIWDKELRENISSTKKSQ